MNSKLRLLIFLAFLLMFLVSAPLVVLYTAGYRFDVSARAIVHTGVLSISSIPKGATVFVDNEPQSDRTPSLLDDILPGERRVRIEKDGYSSWEKTLPVESRNTTFVTDAILFLQSELRTEDTREIIQHTLSPDKHLMAYLISESSWVELWTSGAGESKRLLTRLPFDSEAEYTISWSAEGNYIALEENTVGHSSVSLIDVEQGTTLVTHTILQDADEYWWDAGDDSTLYVRAQGNVYQLSTLDDTEAIIIPDNPQAIISNTSTYLLTKSSDRMVLAKQGDQAVSIITYLPFGTYRFVPTPNSDLLMLEDINRGRVILVELNAAEQPILLNKDMKHWQWDTSGDQLLFSDGFDIEIYTRSSHTTQTFTRLSNEITALLWYPLGNNLIYATSDAVTSIELDSRDGHRTVSLYDGTTQDVWTDPDGDYLFFYGVYNDQTGIHSKQLQR